MTTSSATAAKPHPQGKTEREPAAPAAPAKKRSRKKGGVIEKLNGRAQGVGQWAEQWGTLLADQARLAGENKGLSTAIAAAATKLGELKAAADAVALALARLHGTGWKPSKRPAELRVGDVVTFRAKRAAGMIKAGIMLKDERFKVATLTGDFLTLSASKGNVLGPFAARWLRRAVD